jgi:phage antirepressor YoqD-like protein
MDFELIQETPFQSSATGMDSREIARITGKQHAHVCRDIQVMLRDLKQDQSRFGSVYRGGNGEDRRCFILPGRELLILLTGYDVALRAKVIDRWAELEGKARHKELSHIEILEIALAQAKENQRLLMLVEEQAPAVLAQKRLAGAEGLIGIREAAKRLGWPPKAFVALMVAGEHLFHEGGKLQARADHLAAGRFQMVTGVKEITEGRDHEYGQVKFTAAGLEYFSRKMPDYIALPKKPRKSRAKKKDAA